jgi:predicted TIM-barrel fold metal-dependent hydrolase
MDIYKKNRGALWPLAAAEENSFEDIEESNRNLFPDKTVTPLVFGKVSLAYDVEACTAYVIREAKKRGWPYLYVTRPEWTAADFENRIASSGALGAKVYLNFSPDYIPSGEIRIFDFIPHHQLEVLNAHGWVLMLHIPRAGRLGDPVYIAQMLELARRYPNVKTIIAHIGRAYCDEDVGDAFERLEEAPGLIFEFSANSNGNVMEKMIRSVGPKRIIYGSDSPILRMRMGRITENGTYINLVRKGAYKGIEGDPHMREIEGTEAEKLTYFTYYEIDAFLRAAERCRLTKPDIADVFFNNASALLGVK